MGLALVRMTPEMSRRDFLVRDRRFLEASDTMVREPESVEIELSPLVKYASEGLALVNGKTSTRSGDASEVGMLEMLAT